MSFCISLVFGSLLSDDIEATFSVAVTITTTALTVKLIYVCSIEIVDVFSLYDRILNTFSYKKSMDLNSIHVLEYNYHY